LAFVPVIGWLFDAAFFCDVDGFKPFLSLVDVVLERLDRDWRKNQDDRDVYEDHEALAKVCTVPSERCAGNRSEENDERGDGLENVTC